MSATALISAMLARPKQWRVSTIYADGAVRTHDVHSFGQAENWATGERRKIGRKLLSRETGQTVEVTRVSIEALQ